MGEETRSFEITVSQGPIAERVARLNSLCDGKGLTGISINYGRETVTLDAKIELLIQNWERIGHALVTAILSEIHPLKTVTVRSPAGVPALVCMVCPGISTVGYEEEVGITYYDEPWLDEEVSSFIVENLDGSLEGSLSVALSSRVSIKRLGFRPGSVSPFIAFTKREGFDGLKVFLILHEGVSPDSLVEFPLDTSTGAFIRYSDLLIILQEYLSGIDVELVVINSSGLEP